MDTYPLISVIVQACNVAPFLKECSDSIAHQSCRNEMALDIKSIDKSAKFDFVIRVAPLRWCYKFFKWIQRIR